VAHEIQMARKTAFRSGSKWLPRSVELAAAIAIDEAQDRRRHMDFSTVMDAPTIDGTPDYLGAASDAAGQSDEEAEGEHPAEAARTQVQVSKPGPSEAEIAQRKQLAADQAEQAERATRARQQGETAARRAEADAKQHQKDADDERARQQAEDRARIERDLAQAERGFGGGGDVTNWDDPASYTSSTPGFEAALIDAAGDLVSEPFTDPVAFARAFLDLWGGYGDAARQAMRDFNEDALADAAADKAASVLLASMHAVRQNVAPAIVAVIPPGDRGKPSWPGYVKALKAALGAVSAADFGLWAAAQRDTLETCPMSQRVLAIRAIADAAGRHRLDQPLWLADLIKPKQAAAQAAPPADEKSSDERWVDAQGVALAQMQDAEGRVAFGQLVSSGAVKTIMARLRRENRALFDRADALFTAKHHELPAESDGGEV
jgi:hypothetical protein